MYHQKRFKLMGFFFAALSIYVVVYIFQLGVTEVRVFGAILFALLSIGSFKKSR